MENFYMENGDKVLDAAQVICEVLGDDPETAREVLEVAQVICKHLGSNPENAKEIFNMASKTIDKLAFNPFNGGRVFYRSADELHTVLHSQKNTGLTKIRFARTRDVIKADVAADELMRENRRSERKKIHSISGLLPNSELVSCLWHMAEGELLSDNYISPSYEGGHVYLLLLKACNLDFAIDNEVVKNVGIPPTLFLVRTEKVKASAATKDAVDNEAIRVTRVYATCLDNAGFITEDSRIYDWPWSNVSVNTFGWMCLGNNFGSGALVYPDAASLANLPYDIICNFPTTGHYGVSIDGISYKDLIEFMYSIQGKQFPVNKLIHRTNLNTWLTNAITDLYKR